MRQLLLFALTEADYSPTRSTLTGIMSLARKHRVPVMVHIFWACFAYNSG